VGTVPNTVTVLVPMVKADVRIFESACDEGNRGLPKILSGGRAEDQVANRNLGESSWTVNLGR